MCDTLSNSKDNVLFKKTDLLTDKLRIILRISLE
jgi:hypothetical protein